MIRRLLSSALLAAAPLAGAEDPAGALLAGNRLFRGGDLEAALEAYEAGYDPARRDPVLAYNLGTTAHHLGRLPEAVLWYRRAALDRADPWAADNLAAARRELGTGEPRPPAAALWSEHRRDLWLLAVLLAWSALALLLAAGAGRGARVASVLGGLAALAFAAAEAAPALAPRAAVLLERCGGLPAGSEVWVSRGEEGRWRVAGEPPGTTCPGQALELVEP
jgi:tetratricopeptide (TPR) repeat protein